MWPYYGQSRLLTYLQTQGPPVVSGPPYPPRTAGLGGTPDIIPDIPPTVVFLVLYVVFAITHISIFKRNKARGHKFVFNGALFGGLQLSFTCHV